MAVLGRLQISANTRLDAPDFLSIDSYSAGDWTGFLQSIVGSDSYIIQGFEVFQPGQLISNPASSVDIVIANSSLFWPSNSEGPFFVSTSNAVNDSVTLITNATNYIEMSLTLISGAADVRALWDPDANGGLGGEFTQVVDTENYLSVVISRNNTGFSDDKMPIAKVVVNSSNIVISVTDCRDLLYRLGSGGNSPDPAHNFSWVDNPVGYSRTDTPTTMTSPTDPNVFQGADKNITTLKGLLDALMTRFKEVSGMPTWFSSGVSSQGGQISLANLFLDSQAGHSMQPDRGVTFAWSQTNDGKFRSCNATGYQAPVRWKANCGQIQWALGGSFASSLSRAFSTYTFNVSVADGQNLYLALQRDVALNNDPTVTFTNINGVTASASSASTGSFTGVAVGDFIRKKSGTTYQYYPVIEIRVNSGTLFLNGTVSGTIADNSVQYIILGVHDGAIATSSEGYRYFRSQYQTSDLVASQYGYYDTSYYWIGRRFGTMFYLRDYGDLQPGEKVEVLNDSSFSSEADVGAPDDLILNRAYNSVYDPILGYSLASGSGTLLTIYRRISDNTVGVPSDIDNSQAVPSYTIASAIGVMSDGDGIWVRLGASSGALSSGVVTGTTDNVWQVLRAINTPLRTYDNQNVFLIARKFTISGAECLFFCDGTVLSINGQYVNNNMSIQGDLIVEGSTTYNGPIIYNGAVQVNYGAVQTTNYTVQSSDYFIPFNTSANLANININLPAVSAGNKGRVLILKDVGGSCGFFNKNVSVVPSGANTIDGSNSSVTIDSSYVSITLTSDGSAGWWIS